MQYQGHADFPQGGELLRLMAVYFAAFPDGRTRASDPETVYVRVKPTWVRYSNFNRSPPALVAVIRFGGDRFSGMAFAGFEDRFTLF